MALIYHDPVAERNGRGRPGRRAWRAGKGVLLAMAIAVFGYVAAGLTGGALAANGEWRQPDEGVTIYLEDNGIHTDLVLPKRAAGLDLSPLTPARDLADPRFAGYPWLAVGWGEAAFFLDTPNWSDLRLATVLHAGLGSDRTLVHVEHVPQPRPDAVNGTRRIVLRPEEYGRLVRFVAASIRPGGARHRGYDRYDAFYEASGHYDALRTCNAWTGSALRHAGVRVGRWTPFPITVLGWFPPPGGPPQLPAR
ncbi:conserved hypothetical protein [Sphingomonas gellani]|uniref:TIGR02117 family protein n=2 Tax=Sphingomonas gellani TaxID=1166340 RepID=A0A1H8BBN8_9SPHN|nr:conserved hypothetical protein [Sphingomonas gellani]